MSRARLLGISHKQGDFQGKPFNSIKMHISETFANNGNGKDFGEEVSVQSVKVENIPAVFGQPLSVAEIAQYIGTEIDVYYDKYGHFSQVRFIPPEASKK